MRWVNRSLDGAREYRSQDGQWYIFNPTPWRTMGGYKNWHLHRTDDTYVGSYATMREAKQAAEQRQEITK